MCVCVCIGLFAYSSKMAILSNKTHNCINANTNGRVLINSKPKLFQKRCLSHSKSPFGWLFCEYIFKKPSLALLEQNWCTQQVSRYYRCLPLLIITTYINILQLSCINRSLFLLKHVQSYSSFHHIMPLQPPCSSDSQFPASVPKDRGWLDRKGKRGAVARLESRQTLGFVRKVT